jgi:hypothetical protein
MSADAAAPDAGAPQPQGLQIDMAKFKESMRLPAYFLIKPQVRGKHTMFVFDNTDSG